MSLSTKLLSMLLIRAAVNAYRKLKLSITISEYSTTQRSLCGKEKRYSTQHTIPQNLNLKNILTKPSHLRGLQHFFFLIIITFSWFDTILTPIFYFWCQLIATLSSLVISLSILDISLTWLYTSIVTSMWLCL